MKKKSRVEAFEKFWVEETEAETNIRAYRIQSNRGYDSGITYYSREEAEAIADDLIYWAFRLGLKRATS
jgi:hypothetical protein